MSRAIARRALVRLTRLLDLQPDDGPTLALWLIVNYHANRLEETA